MDKDRWLKQLKVDVRTLLELMIGMLKVSITFELSQRIPTQPALPQVYLQNIIYRL